MSRTLLPSLILSMLLPGCALLDDEPEDKRTKWRLMDESYIAGRFTKSYDDEEDAYDPLVYQRCKISLNGQFLREEVIGQLTPEIEARVASPWSYSGPDEPWLYSESFWTEANEAGESFVCYHTKFV